MLTYSVSKQYKHEITCKQYTHVASLTEKSHASHMCK